MLQIPCQESGSLLTSDRTFRLKGGGGGACGNTGGIRPCDIGGVVNLGSHIGKGNFYILIFFGVNTSQTTQHGNHHATGHGVVGRKYLSGKTVEQTTVISAINVFIVPLIREQVDKFAGYDIFSSKLLCKLLQERGLTVYGSNGAVGKGVVRQTGDLRKHHNRADLAGKAEPGRRSNVTGAVKNQPTGGFIQ